MYIFASQLHMDQLFKERIYSKKSKLISLMIEFILEGFVAQRNQQEVIENNPLCKNGEKTLLIYYKFD